MVKNPKMNFANDVVKLERFEDMLPCLLVIIWMLLLFTAAGEGINSCRFRPIEIRAIRCSKPFTVL